MTLEAPPRPAKRQDVGVQRPEPPVTVIEARSGWRLVDWKELRDYRDLFTFLVWRSIKIRYAQSALGIGWAVIQPLVSTLIFTVIFGNLAEIDSQGLPYALFSLAGLVPWTFFSNALTEGTNSLVSNANMISKVYFPRVILPVSAVLARLVDFAISLVLLFALMAWYGVAPTLGVVLLPLFVLLMIVTASGVGLWLTALAIQYRDIKHAMNFVVQILMYAAPVVYPVALIPEKYRLFYAINPLVGVIEGFRAVLLGTGPVPWTWLGIGILSAAAISLSGMVYFRAKERLFADVA